MELPLKVLFGTKTLNECVKVIYVKTLKEGTVVDFSTIQGVHGSVTITDHELMTKVMGHIMAQIPNLLEQDSGTPKRKQTKKKATKKRGRRKKVDTDGAEIVDDESALSI